MAKKAYEEVDSIAFVQLYGLLPADTHEAPPIKSRVFADHGDDEDLEWVIATVREAHGDEPLVFAADVKFMKAVDGNPNIREDTHLHFWITSAGGPTWGEVIRL